MYLRYFFPCCVFFAIQVAGENLIYALLGKTACFSTDIRTFPDNILWKHNKNKLVEFNGQTQEVFGSFKERISMDWHSAELNISEVRPEDNGLYELETYTNNVLQRAQYNLKVIDKVPKPTISCEMMKGNGSDESGHKATLICSAEQSPSLLTFTWSPNINGQLGPKLIIPLGDEHDNQEYSCTVYNQLSKESATFIAKKCYSDENLSIPMIIGICVGCLVALILLIVGIFMCCKGEKTYDLEKQKPREVEDPSDVGNGDPEKAVLLGRAPTLPSNQPLSHLARDNKEAPFMNELMRSIHKRPGADLSTSLSSPAPEKPPRSQDLPAADKDQPDGDQHGKTVEAILELDPSDSGKINDAVSKQGLEQDKSTLSPSAPEKPPRQDPAVLADEGQHLPAKSTKKRAPNPPPVAIKPPSVKNKTKVDENKPTEETKELPDQNSGEDKVTESETPLSLPLLPETTVPESSDRQPPVPESSDPQSAVPESSDPQSAVPKSSDPQSAVPESSDPQSAVPESSDPQSAVPKSSDPQSPVPKSSDPQSPNKKPPVPLPRSRSSQAFPKNEHKEDSSSDQVAGKPEAENGKESGFLGSGEEKPTVSSKSTGTVTTHEEQPPVTETNKREETLQENNKQDPEKNPKPNGEGDQEKVDPQINQILESSNPDNIKADTSSEASDAAQAAPDPKNQDKTRHSSHSETGSEKEDKSETAEGKNEDQS